MAAKGPHISIKGETLVDFYGFHITNSLLTSVIVTIVFLCIALYYSSQAKKKNKSVFFYMIQGLLDALYNLFSSVLGKNATIFFSLLTSFFLFVLLNNWFGLLPFVGSLTVKPVTIPAPKEVSIEKTVVKTEEKNEAVVKHEPENAPLLRAATADLNTTVALAIVTVFLTQYFAFKYLGAKAHLKKYASPIGFLEGFSEVSRLLSFSFRLFGNIFAGEVMIVIISFLLPVLTPPFFLLEVFVGFIQAVVFSMLSAVFINLAIEEHH